MDWQTLFQNFLTVVIGGGLAGGIVVAYMKQRFEKDAREAAFLKQQLEKLYGSVRFYVSKTEVCFDVGLKFGEVYQSMDEADPDQEVAWSVVAKYLVQLDDCSGKIDEILEKNYAYVDVDDLPIFHRFTEFYLHRKTERKQGGLVVEYSHAIQEKVGQVGFDEFVDFGKRVTERFEAKQKRLRALGGSN